MRGAAAAESFEWSSDGRQWNENSVHGAASWTSHHQSTSTTIHRVSTISANKIFSNISWNLREISSGKLLEIWWAGFVDTLQYKFTYNDKTIAPENAHFLQNALHCKGTIAVARIFFWSMHSDNWGQSGAFRGLRKCFLNAYKFLQFEPFRAL